MTSLSVFSLCSALRSVALSLLVAVASVGGGLASSDVERGGEEEHVINAARNDPTSVIGSRATAIALLR
jgi:hypothetical protein